MLVFCYRLSGRCKNRNVHLQAKENGTDFEVVLLFYQGALKRYYYQDALKSLFLQLLNIPLLTTYTYPEREEKSVRFAVVPDLNIRK